MPPEGEMGGVGTFYQHKVGSLLSATVSARPVHGKVLAVWLTSWKRGGRPSHSIPISYASNMVNSQQPSPWCVQATPPSWVRKLTEELTRLSHEAIQNSVHNDVVNRDRIARTFTNGKKSNLCRLTI